MDTNDYLIIKIGSLHPYIQPVQCSLIVFACYHRLWSHLFHLLSWTLRHVVLWRA